MSPDLRDSPTANGNALPLAPPPLELHPHSTLVKDIVDSLANLTRRVQANFSIPKHSPQKEQKTLPHNAPNSSRSSIKRSRQSSKLSRIPPHAPPLSPIDTLASAAAHLNSELVDNERPSKRARSEAPSSSQYPSNHSRPATSHIPATNWPPDDTAPLPLNVEKIQLDVAESLLALFHSNTSRTPSTTRNSYDHRRSNSLYTTSSMPYIASIRNSTSVQTHTPPDDTFSNSTNRLTHSYLNYTNGASASSSTNAPTSTTKFFHSPQSLPSAGEVDDTNSRQAILDASGLGISVTSTKKKSKPRPKPKRASKQKKRVSPIENLDNVDQQQLQEEDEDSAMGEETKCAKCGFFANSLIGETIHWTQCDGCELWFHLSCTKIKHKEISRIDKYFCMDCEKTHGPPTFFRKSDRNRTNVDYKGLNEGTFSTVDENFEHRYIRHFKDASLKFVLPENFPRLRPQDLTAEYLQRLYDFSEPILVPAALNPRLCRNENDGNEPVEEHEQEVSSDAYQVVDNDTQDHLDMVIPEGLSVRRIAEIHGLDVPLEVIDVKSQEGDASKKWTVGKWADYYDAPGEKPIRNVISLEVSRSPLGRIIRRPKAVRDLDLQDSVWPDEETKRVMVKFYILMSVADSYTDFHIDFGGSSVFYHVLQGHKVFFFIPPTCSNLKKYEQWSKTAAQGHTFLPDQTKECYRADLYPGDTMLIPSGWIHAVWTPADSLVIGGNFLTHMHLGMQIKVHEIEKACGVPLKYRYPYFQDVMWYTIIKYLDLDPIPTNVRNQIVVEQKSYARDKPIWVTYHESDAQQLGTEHFNARYYSRTEVQGWPDLLKFLHHTALVFHDCADGISEDQKKTVIRSIPKSHGDPLDLVKDFAIWMAWKTGNMLPPDWAHPSSELPLRTDVKAKKGTPATRKNPERKSLRSGLNQISVGSSTAPVGPAPSSPKSPALAKDKVPETPKVAAKFETEATDVEVVPGSLVDENEKEKEKANGDAKRRWGKACFDCRKSKRRCIHDEKTGQIDPNKQKYAAKSLKIGAEDQENSSTVKMEIDNSMQEAEVESAVIGPSPKQISLRHAKSMQSLVKQTSPKPTLPKQASPKQTPAKQAEPKEASLKHAKKAPGLQAIKTNGLVTSKSPVSLKSAKLESAKTSPVIPQGTSPEEEASLRVALQLQKDQFGLRSRRG